MYRKTINYLMYVYFKKNSNSLILFWNKHQMSLLIIKQQNIKNKNMKFNFADLQCVDISNLIADLELVGGANV